MNSIYLVFGFGMFASVLAIIAFVMIDKAAERRRRIARTNIAKDYLSTPEINPGLLMAKLGAKQPVQRSLDTMILRPTWGIKLFGLIMAALLIQVMMGSSGAAYREDLITWIIVGGVLVYFGAFLSMYEVRYDSDGVTAPGMFFQAKYHAWSKLIAIERVDNVHYKLIFADGTLKIKKFLVGMPTFLTFASDISLMNRRA